jgi:hypothetical protein
MILKLPPAYPASGQQLLLHGAALNEAPREILLNVIEWMMAEQRPATKENLDVALKARLIVVDQTRQLRAAQRA